MIYKVTGVGKSGTNAPHEWSGQHGTMVDYKVKFQSEDAAVTVTRKQSSPSPQVGDELEGTIDETKFGKKFKQLFEKSFKPGGRNIDDSIKAQFAIKTAVQFAQFNQDPTLKTVESDAIEFFNMVDRVKNNLSSKQLDPIGLNQSFTQTGSIWEEEILDLPEDF